ncbi:MAG: ArnT family glycosyltransferase [Telluria sp.]
MRSSNPEVFSSSRKPLTFAGWHWLVGIIVLGIGLRLAAIALYPHVPESDELAYLRMAETLVAGEAMTDIFGNYAYYNMGYPFFVLAPALALFDNSIFALRIANVIVGAISIAMVYAVARESGLRRPACLLSALLWALYVPSSVYGIYLAKENFMIPLVLGVLWCAVRMTRPFHLGVAALCGGLLGMLALTGNAALSLVAAIGVALILSKAIVRIRLLSIPIILIVATLVTTPWLVRNLTVLGAPVLNTNGGFNFYLGNNPAANGMFVSVAATPRGPSWNALRTEVGEVQASETLKKEALAWITSHPVEFVELSIKKLGLFWMPPVHDGTDGGGKMERLVRFIWLFQFLLLAGAALASVPFVRNAPPLTVLWAAVAAYSAVHMLFYVIFRYREPIMPVLCVLAAVVLERAALGILKYTENRQLAR